MKNNTKQLKITLDRIERFRNRISKFIIQDWTSLQAEYCWSENHVSFDQRHTGVYRPIGEGDVWGEAWESAWFHLRGYVPAEWAGLSVAGQLDFTGEGLVVDNTGRPLQGISKGSVFDQDFARSIVRLFNPAEGGEEVDLWVQTSSNDLFGLYLELDPAPSMASRYGHYQSKVNQIRLAIINESVWHFWLDFTILAGLVKTLPEPSVRRARIIRCLNNAVNVFGDSIGNTDKAREVLNTELKQPASRSDLQAVAVGHAHIDTAWLWPVSETVHKCARTFASQVSLIEQYPTYKFGASQPQHYQFVKENWPGLYKKISELIKAGSWEPQGGMWVEADCNLTSGESLIRQILHGKNFFKNEFGVDVKNLWLPDVFGYSAALPQILKKSGIDYFLTQKLSWSQVNEFPHHTFFWTGIDGSRILTHFPPENTYNSMLNTEFLVPGRDHFHEKDFLDEFMSLFGVGDGGGGPKAENIEFGLRLENLEGAPKVRFDTAAKFFERLSGQTENLETWVGELYLELHRGTLTSQAQIKKYNRKLELELRATEIMASWGDIQDYPAEILDRIWKTTLMNQFHDILPGSSIHQVYQKCAQDFQSGLNSLHRLQDQCALQQFDKDSEKMVMVNTLSIPYRGVTVLPDSWNGGLTSSDGSPVPVQIENRRVHALIELPPLSRTVFCHTRSPRQQNLSAPPGLILENDLVRCEFDTAGRLISSMDKETGNPFLKPGSPGNLLSLYDDHPNDWDAWDIDEFYQEALLTHLEAEDCGYCAMGPVRSGLQFKYRFSNSTIVQKVYLTAGSKRLDFETDVDWHEKHRMLRVSFPTAVRNSEAAFDIQYGYVMRSTTKNTSWDQARFESVGHRYADISDVDYGVALLNDCKYGYHVHDHILDLNLLRAPCYPDADADQGKHRFTYALLPHSGSLVHSNVMNEAARLNQGILVFPGRDVKENRHFVSLESDGITLEVIKREEAADHWIIRLVEKRGGHSNGILTFRDGPCGLAEVDLMEWMEMARLDPADAHEIHLKPFEIRTYRVRSASSDDENGTT